MIFKYLPSYNNYFLNIVTSIFLFFNIFKNKKNMSNSEINIKLNKKTKNKYIENHIKYDKCIKCNIKIYNNKSTYYAYDNIWCYNCWCNIKL